MIIKIKALYAITAIFAISLIGCSQESKKNGQLDKYSNTEIEKIAKAITVKIDWRYSNSGFIINRQRVPNGYKYTILTSKHAVKDKPPVSINVEGLRPEEIEKLGNLVAGNKISG